MDAEHYIRYTQLLKNNPRVTSCIIVSNKLITWVYYAAYPLLLASLYAARCSFAWRATVFPLVGFLLVSVARVVINRPRPYEAFSQAPVISKNTRGKSFPSRHAYASMVIALTFMHVNVSVSVCMIALALCMGVCRVIGGVHYPSDVLTGSALGVVFGVLAFVV